MEAKNEIQLDEIEGVKLALANERVAHARLVLATHQRELEALVGTIREKYDNEGRTVVGLDPARGVLVVQSK